MPNFDWNLVPADRIREIRSENLDYNSLNTDQKQGMNAGQIIANFDLIEDLFSDVDVNRARLAISLQFNTQVTISGPARVSSSGELSTGLETRNLNEIRDSIEASLITVHDDGRIEIRVLDDSSGPSGREAALESAPIPQLEGEGELTILGSERGVLDEKGEVIAQIQGSGFELSGDNGLSLISDEERRDGASSSIVNGVELALGGQANIGDRLGLQGGDGEQVIFDSSRVTSSEAFIRALFNPELVPEDRRESIVPVSESISLTPDIQTEVGGGIEEGFITRRDGIQQRSGMTYGTAETGYFTTPINDRVGLNIVSGEEEIRTIDLQTTNPDAQVFTRTDEEGTTRVRTNAVGAIVDEGTSNSYLLSPLSTLIKVDNQNNQGGIFFQPWMQQGTIGVEQDSFVSTTWGNVGAGVRNLGSNDGILTSTQSCNGFTNCIGRREIGNNQEIISITGGSSSDWDIRIRGNDEIERNYFIEVGEGGKASIDESYTNSLGAEIRRRVQATNSEMTVEGFSDIPSNIFGVMTDLSDGNIFANYILSGQRGVGRLEGSSGLQIRERFILGLEDSPFQEQISAFILSEQKYNPQLFAGDSIFDAFIELGMVELAQSVEARRELYRVLFKTEPSTDSATMNQQLLQRLRLGSEEAFSNIQLETRVRVEDIGTINEQLFGTRVATALQELRLGSSGDVIDPTSLVPEVFSDSFQTIISQDTSEVFSQLSRDQQLSITDTLRAAGVNNPSFEMRRELYRVLEGAYPQGGDSGVAMNIRLLEAIENNEFQGAVGRYNRELEELANGNFGGDLGLALTTLNEQARTLTRESISPYTGISTEIYLNNEGFEEFFYDAQDIGGIEGFEFRRNSQTGVIEFSSSGENWLNIDNLFDNYPLLIGADDTFTGVVRGLQRLQLEERIILAETNMERRVLTIQELYGDESVSPDIDAQEIRTPTSSDIVSRFETLPNPEFIFESSEAIQLLDSHSDLINFRGNIGNLYEYHPNNFNQFPYILIFDRSQGRWYGDDQRTNPRPIEELIEEFRSDELIFDFLIDFYRVR